jgi:hypothetical protein
MTMINGVEIPAPTPEVYDKATEVLELYGWGCGAVMPGAADFGHDRPHCGNGVMMVAIGMSDEQPIPHGVPAYEAICRPLVMALVEEGHLPEKALNGQPSSEIISWNDSPPSGKPNHELSAAERDTSKIQFRGALLRAKEIAASDLEPAA